MGTVTSASLWPPFTGPAQLTEVERIPLTERGLPASTYELVTRAAELWPERPAVSVLPDAERFQTPFVRTFAELAHDVHRAVAVLSDLGVRRGDAVAVVSVNCAEMLSLLLAAEAVGIYAPINPGLTPEHAVELTRLAGARVIVAAGPELDAGVWAHARAIAQSCGARALLALRPTAAAQAPPPLEPLDGVEVAYLSDRIAAVDPASPPEGPPKAGDVASYLHTGGTTGLPKLAARTHANEVSNAWMTRASTVLDEDSVIFAALPLFHTNALVVTVLGPLLKGQHVVWAGPLGYRDVPLFQNFWRIVEHFRLTAMSGVPTIYSVLTQMPVDADISSLRLPIVGAAPLPPAVASGFEARTGVRLCEGYGLTEGTCASALSWPDAPRPGTVGQRLPYQQARTIRVDEATGEWTFLPEGEMGTLVLRGPNVFPGYLTTGESGSAVHADGKVRDGWLDTGDLASVDADGFIRLAGRAKDLIIRGGHNIDPAAIEDALLEHPDVTAVAAVGRPDPYSGEVPVAFVTLAAGSRLAPSDLEAWALDHVPERAAAPKHVEIVPEIPHTAVGKPYKPELRRRAAERAARDTLAEMGLADLVRAVLTDGAIEIQVPHSLHDDDVARALSQYAWNWKLGD
ncbi:MAG TPA: acyl-CoA synthetase [Solirubrobacteraceae bacterium]|nr:acyl-CoA synthetase [Solirubrobacteraceae bacterium]